MQPHSVHWDRVLIDFYAWSACTTAAVSSCKNYCILSWMAVSQFLCVCSLSVTYVFEGCNSKCYYMTNVKDDGCFETQYVINVFNLVLDNKKNLVVSKFVTLFLHLLYRCTFIDLTLCVIGLYYHRNTQMLIRDVNVKNIYFMTVLEEK